MTEAARAPETTPTERKRERLLDAAAHCFARLGFAKTTVEEIAQTAGVSKGLLYVHFSSKEVLLEAVLARTLAAWNDATRTAVAREQEAHQGSIATALATMHRESIHYALRHPLLRQILDRDNYLILSHVDEPARRAMEEWGERLRNLLAEGVRRGELRGGIDVERTADVLRLLHLAYLERLFDSQDIEATDPDLIDCGIDTLLFGIVKPQRSTTARKSHRAKKQ